MVDEEPEFDTGPALATRGLSPLPIVVRVLLEIGLMMLGIDGGYGCNCVRCRIFAWSTSAAFWWR